MKIRTIFGSRAVAAIPTRRWPSRNRDGSSFCVCIIGVGYVGESLLTEFTKHFDTVGYDVSPERIEALQAKYPATSAAFTTDPSHLTKGTHFLIAVPTPLKDEATPDLTCLASALETVFAYAQPGTCIVIESSIPVGTTRHMLGPVKDVFNCGMSPERIDPGRQVPVPRDIPKIVSGLTPKALKKIASLYGAVYTRVVPVSKPEVAEMTKLYENCYRMVNIAYVNEMSDACRAHGIDTHEVIGAASTKPFGFQPFYPGLGVGGHCIPLNPFYMFHNNPRMRVLELATTLMQHRPIRQANRFYHQLCLAGILQQVDGVVNRPRILVVGLGFKAGHSSTVGSPAVQFSQQLQELGCERLAYYDPSKVEISWMEKLDPLCWNSNYVDLKFDGVAICNAQPEVDLREIQGLQHVLVKQYF